ncbi:MAG: hypothetical protein ACFFAS_00950 [Promethearchaeota archaeon]
MVDIDPDKLRDLNGWEKNAPIPICMGGDYRALTFCCKPGYALTFGYKCRRDDVLSDLNIDPQRFIEIKQKFSDENNWNSDLVCFGSISYCCMRSGGCPRRDAALTSRYPGLSREEFMKVYFQKKKELSRIILECVEDPEARKKISEYLEMFDE